jgi:hypothetical protein
MGSRAVQVDARRSPAPAQQAEKAPARQPAAADVADAGAAALREGAADAMPDCLASLFAVAEPLRDCANDPANRDYGVRFAVTRGCEVKEAVPWGQVDDAIRACLAAKVAIKARETAAPVWFVDYPLGALAFKPAVNGIGEIPWLRRGLPMEPAAMKGVATIALGPKRRSERADVSATFGSRRYRIRTVGGPSTEPYEPALVALESEGRTQILVHDIQDFRVRWAGDVDGDDRLDLLIQSTETSFAQRFDLFLSGDAEGRLVRLAAVDADEAD